MAENEIPDFLADLADATSKKGRGQISKDLKVLNMKSQKNWGKVIIVPIEGEGKGEGAIKQLNRVARVEKWVSGTKQDGTEYGFVQKLYFFLDPKYYGDLTEEQSAQLERIKSKFNTVNSSGSQSVGVHQLTLIQGLVVKHTDKSTPVKTLEESVPCLCIYESKNFEKAFRKTITDMADVLGSYAWLNEMCNRSPLRKRYLSIDFYLNKEEGAGFQATTSLGKFDEDAIQLTGGTIGLDLSKKEEGFFDKFKDPIKYWLGIPQDKPRFNDDYMNDIEVILNNLLRGENTVETRTQSQGVPEVPNSNAGFQEQSEVPPIPTDIKSDEEKEVEKKVEESKEGDLPF